MFDASRANSNPPGASTRHISSHHPRRSALRRAQNAGPRCQTTTSMLPLSVGQLIERGRRRIARQELRARARAAVVA